MKIIATIKTFEQVGQEDYKNLYHSKEYDVSVSIEDIINDMSEFVKYDEIDGIGRLSYEKIFSKLILSVKK